MVRLTIAAAVLLSVTASASADVVAPDDVVFEDGAINRSLTGAPGDPAKGREWFLSRKLGNCLACHANKDLSEQPFHGEVGPPLDGVADRWSTEELRGIVTNSKMIFEGTIMPAFYKASGINRPLEKFAGKPILSAQQVEDVIAYLATLKE